MWSCPEYPETNREKHASGQSAPWDRKLVSPGILDSLNSGMYHQYCGSFVLINMFSCNHADSHSSEWCLILQLKTYQDSIILNIIFRKNAGCLMYVYQWKIGFFTFVTDSVYLYRTLCVVFAKCSQLLTYWFWFPKTALFLHL